MILAFFVLAAMPDLVPARWPSDDLKSLDLVRDTPVNCLLLEEPQWSPAFVAEAAKRGIAVFGVIRPTADLPAAAKHAASVPLTGAVLEGAFERSAADRLRGMLADAKLRVVELTARSEIKLDSADAIVGTYQGVWPGVQALDEKAQKAAPSGGPWIDTNTGFLRFMRAATKSAVWVANTPPRNMDLTPERYLQAIGDAAMTGARWVIALDDDTNKKLMAGERTALATWKRITQTLRYYEDHADWRNADPFAQLAIVEDAGSGALLSGGILDMIAVKHTPVRPVPNGQLSEGLSAGAKLAVNVDPASLNQSQKDALRAFTTAGGTLLTGPPGWKFPTPKPGQITLEKEDLAKLDEIWKELNALTGRKNLGARLFNVSAMLSNLTETKDRKQVILQLVNYSEYPVENVTVHVLGNYKSAMLYRPDGAPLKVVSYEVDEGTGLDVDKVGSVATLVLTR